MWINIGIAKYFSWMRMLILLAPLLSFQAWADAASDWEDLQCDACHGSDPFALDLSSYTNATLKTKIQSDMPAANTGLGTDPSQCDSSCAIDMANYLLPLTEVEPPVVTDNFAFGNIGTAPLDVSFNVRLSKCEGIPCEVLWEFSDGTTFSETSYTTNLNDLLGLSHTFSSTGPNKVRVTITDVLGQYDQGEMYVYIIEEGETFSEYVEDCKLALDFNDDDIPNDLNCATGHLFAEDGGVAVNDFVDYRQVTAEVELVFACRWLQNGTGPNHVVDPPFVLARSIEMILHNRINGNTCFFKAKNHPFDVSADPEDNDGVVKAASVNIVSPTVAANALPGTSEYEYWDDPVELATGLACVDCHVAGPYIVTPRISPFMQRFGLLNDGHDTFGRLFTSEDVSDGDYHIVGDTFEFMNHFAAFNNDMDPCASACHSVGNNSTKLGLEAGIPPNEGLPAPLIPAIKTVINSSGEVGIGNVMPANNPPVGPPNSSHYTWINRGNPYLDGSSGDSETFLEAQAEYETLLNYCGDPGDLYAHLVDDDYILRPQPFSDHLSVFNAQDGVVCITSEQGDGQCNDFRVRYQCTNSMGVVSWTDWYNTDSPSISGDYERRSDHANVCVGSTVTGIEASSTISTGWTGAIRGPVDRLAQFDRYGLVCNNNDQNDNQCDNYVVKFAACSDAPVEFSTRISSAWSGRVLTASDTYNNALTKAQPSNGSWSSQDWVVEPVPGTGYVRLRNEWSGTYLNSQSDAEYADIVIYDFVEEWGSQQWIMENVPGNSSVRFKNVWTGRYLTVTGNGDYAEIKSQSLNTRWSSQRWFLSP